MAYGARMDRSHNPWIAAGAFNGLIAVAMGAFAAHGLRSVLSGEPVGWVATAANYELWHALALLAVGLLWPLGPDRRLAVAGWAFLLGIVLFSGSLYLLALSGWPGFAFVTPLGGTALLVGWASLAWYSLSRSSGSA
jgi:uncharacterized membrane protein YgdD (TMEM256/DUF423 family)